MNIGEALRFFSGKLSEFTEDEMLEARLIIQKATGLSRPVLLSHPERDLDDAELEQIRALCAKRGEGVPLPYLMGEWEFYGHAFDVDPSVLIPRPETELLVDEAKTWLKKHPFVKRGYDIGTGSGCIAVSLLLDFPGLDMAAVDIKWNALWTACRNAEKHHCKDRFHPVCADLFSAFSGKAQLVCANLPYIPTETCRSIEPARFEPMAALDGGFDGFELYRLLFQQLKNKIEEKHLILCEIEYRQRDLALHTAEGFFPGSSVSVLSDLAGMPRLLRIEGKGR